MPPIRNLMTQPRNGTGNHKKDDPADVISETARGGTRKLRGPIRGFFKEEIRKPESDEPKSDEPSINPTISDDRSRKSDYSTRLLLAAAIGSASENQGSEILREASSSAENELQEVSTPPEGHGYPRFRAPYFGENGTTVYHAPLSATQSVHVQNGGREIEGPQQKKGYMGKPRHMRSWENINDFSLLATMKGHSDAFSKPSVAIEGHERVDGNHLVFDPITSSRGDDPRRRTNNCDRYISQPFKEPQLYFSASQTYDLDHESPRSFNQSSCGHTFRDLNSFTPSPSMRNAQDLVEELERQRSLISKLETKNDELTLALERAVSSEPYKPTWRIVYRLFSNTEPPVMYLDAPRLVQEGSNSRLVFSRHIANWELFMERNKDVGFIVYKDYESFEEKTPSGRQKGQPEEAVNNKPLRQSLMPVSKDLQYAIYSLLGSKPHLFETSGYHFQGGDELPGPYLFLYRGQRETEPLEDGLNVGEARHLSLLRQYVHEEYKQEYAYADDLLSRGLTTQSTMKYLYRPQDIIVSGETGVERGYVLSEWPRLDQWSEDRFILQVHSWSFSGSFKRKKETLRFGMPEGTRDKFQIRDLKYYPRRFAAKSVCDKLRKRGETIWTCRFRRLVMYWDPTVLGTLGDENGGERCMIDTRTHSQLHDKNSSKGFGWDESQSADMIQGFSLKEKKWHDLSVDYVSEVRWDKHIFEGLVLSEKTKKIIRALVSKQTSRRKPTDLVKGKGNGLIILLHGGPGTGKTLTAESVAELVEKPLYRVTCGNVGTDPAKVEQYLESVFHLSKIWDCVVLLDEADVFLQERNLQDLQRNALVAVFLRILEYHEGILFLTSNRIGTFDEAFRSRIQLSLHYKSLGLPERKKIWRKFIRHLQQGGAEDNLVDFDDLYAYVDDLAAKELNGRQIRNSITIARQVAEYDGVKLTHERIFDVLEIAADFDTYVKKVQYMSDDEKMLELGVRAP